MTSTERAAEVYRHWTFDSTIDDARDIGLLAAAIDVAVAEAVAACMQIVVDELGFDANKILLAIRQRGATP